MPNSNGECRAAAAKKSQQIPEPRDYNQSTDPNRRQVNTFAPNSNPHQVNTNTLATPPPQLMQQRVERVPDMDNTV